MNGQETNAETRHLFIPRQAIFNCELRVAN